MVLSRGFSVPCGGISIAVSEPLQLVVVCTSTPGSVFQVFGLQRGFPKLASFGSCARVDPIPLSSVVGQVTFPPWEHATLLVADTNGNRVQEVNVRDKRLVHTWFDGAVDRPQAIAASRNLVAVFERGSQRISVFSCLMGLKVKQIPCGAVGPRGLVLTGNGTMAAVDGDEKRLSVFKTSNWALDRHIGTSLADVTAGCGGVVEVSGRFVVTTGDNLTVLSDAGQHVVGGRGSAIAQFQGCAGLATATLGHPLSTSLFVVERSRFQVFETSVHDEVNTQALTAGSAGDVGDVFSVPAESEVRAQYPPSLAETESGVIR
jgi:hypothetical protein